MLTLNEQEEKVIEKIVSAIADYIQIEPMQITPVFMLSFPKLEIRHHHNAGYLRAERKSTLPALNTASLYSLLLIPTLSLQGYRYLKLFGTWTMIAANLAFLP